MHATPIHASAIDQTAARRGAGANSATRIAPFGAHHARTLARVLLTQSAETGNILSGMVLGATRGCFDVARAVCLHRRAWHRSIRAELGQNDLGRNALGRNALSFRSKHQCQDFWSKLTRTPPKQLWKGVRHISERLFILCWS